MRKCKYCNTLGEGSNCSQCGAPLDENKNQYESETIRGTPFFHNGYIVWWIVEDFAPEIVTYYFYLGERLVETIKITREVIREIVDPGVDSFYFIWDLFKVAQGEEEVLRVQQMNVPRPVMFEIRRVPDQYEEYARGLTMNDIYQAAIEGKTIGL